MSSEALILKRAIAKSKYGKRLSTVAREGHSTFFLIDLALQRLVSVVRAGSATSLPCGTERDWRLQQSGAESIAECSRARPLRVCVRLHSVYYEKQCCVSASTHVRAGVGGIKSIGARQAAGRLSKTAAACCPDAAGHTAT